MIEPILATLAGAVAGFAASAAFLWSLSAQVKRTVAQGRAPVTLPLSFLLRVGLVGGLVGATLILGPWSALGGLAGFTLGRIVLTGVFAARLAVPVPAVSGATQGDDA